MYGELRELNNGTSIDNVFHEWEENLQTHACPINFVHIIDLACRGVSVAQW